MIQRNLPTILQGGMGVGVSGWRLARELRRALEHFPAPCVVDRILATYLGDAARSPNAPLAVRRHAGRGRLRAGGRGHPPRHPCRPRMARARPARGLGPRRIRACTMLRRVPDPVLPGGIQVGTAFARYEESGLLLEIKRRRMDDASSGDLVVPTDFRASPTESPFHLVEFPMATLGKDLGFLPYFRDPRTGPYEVKAVVEYLLR